MTLTITTTGAVAGADAGGAAAGHAHPGGAPSTSAARIDPMADPGPGFTARDPAAPPTPAAGLHRVELRVQEVVREVAPGVRQQLWTFNGTAPGPVLRGRLGDTFEITLINEGGIDPPDLPRVDHEFVLVQSELYLGADAQPGDLAKMQAERPDAVVFNGYVAQYAHRPLAASAGQRVRFWVLNAGPNRTSAFHLVGTAFDTVYREGRWQLRPTDPGGAQVLDLVPAAGGFVETVLPEPGHYPFVSHVMVDAERGARGVVEVSA